MSVGDAAFVAFGSNLNNPVAQLRGAASAVKALPGVSEFCGSSLYCSPAMGGPAQGDYCNAVARLCWSGDAASLLAALLTIEAAAGRQRLDQERNAPRTLDLDLLLFADLQLDQPQLQVPHPRMTQRAFVLVPLAELQPELVLPGLAPLQQLLPAVSDQRLERLPVPRLGEPPLDVGSANLDLY